MFHGCAVVAGISNQNKEHKVRSILYFLEIRKTVIPLALINILSFPAFGYTNLSADRIYINQTVTESTPTYLKSFTLDEALCAEGGYSVKFYNADPVNFCKNFSDKQIRKFEKCLGREHHEIPFPPICIGRKKTVTEVTETTVDYNPTTQELIRRTTTTLDKKMTYEESQILSVKGDEATLRIQFISYDPQNQGDELYYYIVAGAK